MVFELVKFLVSYFIGLFMVRAVQFSGVKRNFWSVLFVSYFASQCKTTKFVDYFFDVCCAN